MTTTPAAKSIVTLAEDNRTRNGVFAALAAYLLWGFFPILFHLLEGVGAPLVVAHRVVWSLVVVGAILYFGGRWAEVTAAFADRRSLWRIFISALLLGVNWLVYVWAVENDRVLETSFGYFINPLANVALGMVLLGERQNPWQWVSIAIAAVAMVIQAVAVGGIPWVAVSVAVSFALYGYFRKTVEVGSATGLFVEALLLSPVALGYIGYTIATTGPGPHADPGLMGLLVLTGPSTSAALLFFAFAVQRLRLTTIGMFQYLSPTIQFLLAVLAFGESLDPVRLLSFGLIWVSLVVFSADSFRRRKTIPAPQTP